MREMNDKLIKLLSEVHEQYKARGNFGHAGRPGHIGGSAPGGGSANVDKLISYAKGRLSDAEVDIAKSLVKQAVETGRINLDGVSKIRITNISRPPRGYSLTGNTATDDALIKAHNKRTATVRVERNDNTNEVMYLHQD